MMLVCSTIADSKVVGVWRERGSPAVLKSACLHKPREKRRGWLYQDSAILEGIAELSFEPYAHGDGSIPCSGPMGHRGLRSVHHARFTSASTTDTGQLCHDPCRDLASGEKRKQQKLEIVSMIVNCTYCLRMPRLIARKQPFLYSIVFNVVGWRSDWASRARNVRLAGRGIRDVRRSPPRTAAFLLSARGCGASLVGEVAPSDLHTTAPRRQPCLTLDGWSCRDSPCT
nr:hypothetical protein CFP56_03762 [Quercus suber]